MYRALVSDLSKTLISATDKSHAGTLNGLHAKLITQGDYNFWAYFRLHQDLLAFYETIRATIDLFIFTTDVIQEYPPLSEKLRPIFKEIFSSNRMGLPKKSEPEAYRIIAKRINFPTSEILFVDDSQKNLFAALTAGMGVVRFQSERQAIQDISKALNYT